MYCFETGKIERWNEKSTKNDSSVKLKSKSQNVQATSLELNETMCFSEDFLFSKKCEWEQECQKFRGVRSTTQLNNRIYDTHLVIFIVIKVK